MPNIYDGRIYANGVASDATMEDLYPSIVASTIVASIKEGRPDPRPIVPDLIESLARARYPYPVRTKKSIVSDLLVASGYVREGKTTYPQRERKRIAEIM